jgi:hypothetical protein
MKKQKKTEAIPVQYDPATDVEKLALTLIPKYHSHLVNCKIAYLYKNKPIKSKGRDVAATAEKVSAKSHALSGFDFLIVIAFPTYRALDPALQLAVLDHELEHCWVEENEKTGKAKCVILPHDVEEFSQIVLRHGLYTTSLLKLGNVVSDKLLPENINNRVVIQKLGDVSGKTTVLEEEPVEEAKLTKAVKVGRQRTSVTPPQVEGEAAEGPCGKKGDRSTKDECEEAPEASNAFDETELSDDEGKALDDDIFGESSLVVSKKATKASKRIHVADNTKAARAKRAQAKAKARGKFLHEETEGMTEEELAAHVEKQQEFGREHAKENMSVYRRAFPEDFGAVDDDEEPECSTEILDEDFDSSMDLSDED